MLTNGTSSVTGELTDRLKELGADKPHLMEVAKTLASFGDKILGNQIFVRGIPAVDQVALRSIISVEFLHSFVTHLTSVPSLRTIKIFPYGVPVFDVFQVESAFGNVAVEEQSSVSA